MTALTGSSAVRRIALVRHAATAWNVPGKLTSHTDLALSETGREEAVLLARRLRDEMPASRVWTSPSLRARETAAEICAYRETEARVVPDAGEADFGRFEGLSRDDLTGGPTADLYARWERGLPVDDAEALTSVAVRAERVFADMLNESDANDVILVSHGVFIRVLLCVTVLGLRPTEYRRLLLDNAGVSIVRVDQESRRLSLLNSCEHLGHLRGGDCG